MNSGRKLIENNSVFLKWGISLLPYILVFYASLHFPKDPDLGMHLKYGEYFFNHGQLLQENIFSHLMEGYRWINTSWGIDLITYSIFNSFGFLGLMLAGALTITLTFYFFSKAFNLALLEQALIFPLMIFLEYPLIRESFKGQQVSILFLSIQFYLLEKYFEKNNKKLTIFLTTLFLIWSNIHAQFILGLGVFLLWLLVRTFAEKAQGYRKRVLFPVIIVFFVASATLINPYGYAIYLESLKLVGNSKLREIIEYNPLYMTSRLLTGHLIVGFLLYAYLVIFFVSKDIRKSYRSPYLLISSIFYPLALFVRRYAWSLYYLTIPLLQALVKEAIPKVFKHQNLIITALLITQILYLVGIKNPRSLFADLNWDTYCDSYRWCSPGAGEYILKNNLNTKKVFTIYSWSGYLIWNFPQIPPPVDGRMLLWKDGNGFSGYDYYNAILLNQIDIDKTDYQVAMVNTIPKVYKRLLQLEKENKWELVYKDKYANVFIKKR